MFNVLKAFWNDEEGVGIIEVILILVVLIMLIVIFRNKIKEIAEKAFSSISKNGSEINKDLELSRRRRHIKKEV